MKTKDKIQAEALLAIGTNQLAGVEVSMGVGKTRLGLKHMADNYTDITKYLVVASKLSIFDSWKTEAENSGYGYLLEHIDFSTYRSLNKQNLDYDIIYLDECHNLKNNHDWYLTNAVLNEVRIVGFTGTYPIYSNSEKGRMVNKFCPKVYVYKTDQAIDDSILNDYKIYIHHIHLDTEKNITKKTKAGKTFMTSEASEYAYWSKRVKFATTNKESQITAIQRMRCLKDSHSKIKYAKKLLKVLNEKTIVFASTTVQADSLCKHSYHSKNKESKENLENFKAGVITKLSAVEQLSEGVNIPGLKCGIILHSYGNNRKAAQKIGRLLRLNVNDTAEVHILCYIDTVDEIWVNNALSSFDQSKIKITKFKY